MTPFYDIRDQTSAVLDLTTDGPSGELAQLERRIHVLRAQLDALSKIDEVNQTVQFSINRGAALEALMHEPFHYSPEQAAGVLDLPLSCQSAEEVQCLRQEFERLTSHRLSKSEHFSEALAFHWFG